MTNADAITVLHVDDESALTELVATSLPRENDRITVVTAQSASEGLDRLSENDVDCVVSDYEMPDTNGFEFLEELRGNGHDIPFILYTGKGSEEIASEAISAGVDDYLEKRSGNEQYELLANRITNAVSQYRSVARAENLERIRGVINNINRALVRAETPCEVEERVCSLLTEAEPYRFAWIGDYDPESEEITPHTSGGVERGYLDEIEITADDQPTGRGPSGRAVRTRELSVTQSIPENPDFEPWRTDALERGYRASAAIPLLYNEELYGVLNVYADRSHAFDEEEQTLLQEVANDTARVLHSFESRDRLEAYGRLVESLPIGVYRATTGIDGTVLDANPALVDMMDAEAPEQLIGREISSFLLEKSEYATFLEDLREAGFIREKELHVETLDGTEKWVSITAIQTDKERPAQFEGIIQDITERKEREAALRRSQQFIEESQNALQDVFYVLNDRNEIIHYNRRMAEVSGYDEAELETMNPIDFFPPEEQKRILDSVKEVLETGSSTIQSEIQTKQGDKIPYEFRATRLENPYEEGMAIAGVGRDITERKQREKDLLISEYAIESAFSGIAIANLDGVVTAANPSCVELWGYDSESEIIGQPVTEFWKRPDVATKVGAAIKETGQWKGDLLAERKDGTTFHAESLASAITDEDGNVCAYMASFVDITGRKERERRLQKQAERLEEFASVVSHDLRSPLNVAMGWLQVINDDQDVDHLEKIETALDRMEDIISDTLVLAREGETVGDPEPVDIQQYVQQCWEMVETPEANLAITEGFQLYADPNRLSHIFENVFRNTLEHGRADATIRIGPIETKGFYIEDDGPGIPEDEREKVLTSGYSRSDSGTGMGLAIVNRIAEAHGWTLSVTESSDGGARFEFTNVDIPEPPQPVEEVT